MEKIKIVFGTDNNKNLWKGHFGDSEIFNQWYVYAGGKTEFVKSFINTRKDMDEKHASEEKLNAVKAMLNECDCAVAVSMSPNFKKMAENTALQPLIVTDCADVPEMFTVIVKNFDKISEEITKRKKGGREKNIPKYEK
ncbi:MAG: hypothetical protein JXR81_10885 [Candidatus Goldbacteria bacterium]|nr:hypothetical protein [Candidatus Goldiibacteriota bacterium]